MTTKIVAVVTQKGGSGKSTIATHLAGEAAKRGVLSCILDTDPQKTSAVWGKQRLAAGMDQPAVLDIGPLKLADTIEIAKADEFGFVVVDTPGRVDAVTSIVKNLDAQIIIPLRPTSLDLVALAGTLNQLGDAADRAVVVLSQVQQWVAETQETRDWLAANYPKVRVFPGVIMHRAAYYRALGAGRTVADLENPTGSEKNAANEVAELYDWLETI